MSESYKKTGAIWRKPARIQARLVNQVCEIFDSIYGRPRLGNPDEPIDDLIFIIISNKTTPKQAIGIYKVLKSSFDSWEELLVEPIEKLSRILAPAGLANVKASQIKGSLIKIASDFGDCDLHHLIHFSEEEQLTYLQSLPGVSGKVARCVMMYSLGGSVLPVDSHVHRISRRLGWTAQKRADQSHEELAGLVPKGMRYVFHVGCIMHGRAICRARQPACEACLINEACDYFLSRSN